MLLTLSIRQPSRSKQNARIICLIVKITLITCKYNNSIYIARSCVVIEDLNFQNISCFELDRKSQQSEIYCWSKLLSLKWLEIMFKPKTLWTNRDAILWRHTVLSTDTICWTPKTQWKLWVWAKREKIYLTFHFLCFYQLSRLTKL